jgi:hypothetical protein
MQLLLTVNGDVLYIGVFYQTVAWFVYFSRWLGVWFCRTNGNFNFKNWSAVDKKCTRIDFEFAKHVLNEAKQKSNFHISTALRLT